jgi:glycosyltransferase involved in cell wall biosynthesis
VFCGAKKNFYYKIIQYLKNKKITNIKYLGVVNDDELIKTYNLCSLVIVPTKEESSCILLKESFALKKNLLVSNTEVFKEYSKLFKLNLFDLNDNNDLQKKIANIYFGKKQINKINYNYKKVKLYTWEAIAKKFMELTL